jgi:hypothetical protein
MIAVQTCAVELAARIGRGAAREYSELPGTRNRKPSPEQTPPTLLPVPPLKPIS